MNFHYLFTILLFFPFHDQHLLANGFGCNWGIQSTHPLSPNIVVKLMKDNGFDKVKLFEADPRALDALGGSGIQVMVGIPNDMLAAIASSVLIAQEWVRQNISYYMSTRAVDIRYVAVGNEPFLQTYNNQFAQVTYPALQNIQAALIAAGLGQSVKTTIPLNADVYESRTGVPSGGNFRTDIHDLMITIMRFLNASGSPLTINIYPYLSLYADPNFPIDFALFDGNATPVVDGSISYTNVFDANYDTLISTLEKNGFGSIPVIVGEIGWPTDGDRNANAQLARRFNQGLINHINQGKGTPKRTTPPDIYFFSLLDEDAKSIIPGNFERHWGVFYFDGTIKYPLNLGNGRNITSAKGVRYLDRQWCIMASGANILDPNLPLSINLACTYADCTSLGFGSSCGALDVRGNATYAFNMYYQTMNQQRGACEVFNNLTVITTIDPGYQGGSCRYEIMIDNGRHEQIRNPGILSAGNKCGYVVSWAFMFTSIVFIICLLDSKFVLLYA